MTFGKCRFDRKHEWELVRFCSKLNTKVIGGAGRLLRRFEEDYKPVSPVSYADRQWSRGAGCTRRWDSGWTMFRSQTTGISRTALGAGIRG